LTGNPLKTINSNALGPNPSITILEHINALPEYKNKVAVFSSWKAFPDIINETRSGIYVNSSFTSIPESLATSDQLNIQNIYDLLPRVIGDVRYDGLTFMLAFEHLKKHRPRVLMIALDETDEFGHAGQYDQYLQSLHRTDRLIEDLWKWIQHDSAYRNKTTLIITTDHGRGKGRMWKKHGRLTPHSDETWLVMMGPDIEPQGELKIRGRFYNAQIAATLATLLGVTYTGNNPHYAQLTHPVPRKSEILANKLTAKP
jgi:hypothetical protein